MTQGMCICATLPHRWDCPSVNQLGQREERSDSVAESLRANANTLEVGLYVRRHREEDRDEIREIIRLLRDKANKLDQCG